MNDFDTYIICAVIILAALLYVFSYAMISSYEKSYFNILVPALFVQAPIYFVLEPLNLYLNGPRGSLFGYIFVYACYTAGFVFFALGYRFLAPSNWRILQTIVKYRENKESKNLHVVLLIISWGAMFPVLYEYRDLLATPRKIYEATRTGYGIFFFSSAMLNNLAFIAFLFLKRKSFFGSVVFIFLLLVNVYLHGAKGQFIYILMIYFAYNCYVVGKKMNGRKFILSFGGMALLLVSLFTVFAPQRSELVEMAVGISEYSDYSRNGIMVIDSDIPLEFGKMTLDQAVYSRLPRFLYPDKPKDYGVFALAKRFYPEQFENDTGAAAFGVGAIWADFGVFSLLYIILWAVFLGGMTKTFAYNLKESKNMGVFAMLLFLIGIDLMPVGAGYTIVEHFILFLLLAAATTRRVRSSKIIDHPRLMDQKND